MFRYSGGLILSAVTCTGWWEQPGLGRQPMNALQLRFNNGRIFGSGVDVVGDFLVEGTVDAGTVAFTKQYVDAHDVQYTGTFDGEGTLQGVWSIFGVGGRWLIRVIGDRRSDQIVDLF